MNRWSAVCMCVLGSLVSSSVWAMGNGSSPSSPSSIQEEKEESVAMPEYILYLAVCTKTLSDSAADNTSITEKERIGLSTMLCHCSYEELGPSGSFNSNQFENSLYLCGEKAKRNPEGFVVEYGRKVSSGLERYQDEVDDDEDW